MNTEPTIGNFYDEEEKSLIEDMEATINDEQFVPQSILSPERMQMHRKAARNARDEKSIDAFFQAIDELTPVKSKVSSTEAIRLLRQGRDHELSDQLKT